MNGEAGKGDTYRQMDQKKWDENYERIFGKKKSKNLQSMSRNERAKQTAEVFTPTWLAQQMLSKLPETVWEEGKTFCDPACGNGNLLVEVLKEKLKRGHDPLRALQTIYGVDIMEDNVRECCQHLSMLLGCSCDDVSSRIRHIDLTIYKNGSLEYDFGSLFDVIFMNPPYQGGTKNSVLWDKFVWMSHGLVKDNGYLCHIHPTGWREPYGAFKPINNLLLKQSQLEYLEVHDEIDGQKTFKASTAYDWYVAKKCLPTHPTIMRQLDGTEISVELRTLPFIPNSMVKEVLALVAKDNEEKCEVLYDAGSYHTQRAYVITTQSETHPYPCIYSIGTKNNINLKWSSINNKGHFGTPKVIFTNGAASGTLCDLDGKYGLTEFAYAIVDAPENLPLIEKAIRSPKFLEIMKACSLISQHRYNRKVLSTFRKDFWKDFL